VKDYGKQQQITSNHWSLKQVELKAIAMKWQGRD